MYKLEIKQGSFIQQTQYFILVGINDFYRICSDFLAHLTCHYNKSEFNVLINPAYD